MYIYIYVYIYIIEARQLEAVYSCSRRGKKEEERGAEEQRRRSEKDEERGAEKPASPSLAGGGTGCSRWGAPASRSRRRSR